MPQIIEPPSRTLPSDNSPRVRWNIGQFENLFTMGLLPEKGFELIAGDIIEKMPIKYAHARAISLLFALFSRISGFPLLLSQFSLLIDENTLPEPDFVVLISPDPTLTTRGYVQVANVRLVVEVSDATLPYDLTTKARLYARAGIPEYWVIDVNGRSLIIHTAPGGDGYAEAIQYMDSDTAAPLFALAQTFPVADILP